MYARVYLLSFHGKCNFRLFSLFFLDLRLFDWTKCAWHKELILSPPENGGLIFASTKLF